jgi:hypothetical protein
MDSQTQILRDLVALVRRAPRNGNRELVAAVAAGDRARRQPQADDVAHRSYGFGTGQVPMSVVQRLQTCP